MGWGMGGVGLEGRTMSSEGEEVGEQLLPMFCGETIGGRWCVCV